MRKLIFISLIACILSTSVFSQLVLTPSVVASGGQDATGDNISISWTLGELAINTLSSGDLILTQGFHQPFGVVVGLMQDEANLAISVFPNPVGDELSIQFDIENSKNVILEIQDVSGRIITRVQNKQVNSGDIVKLNTSSFKPGVYVLSIIAPNRQKPQVFSVLKL